MRHHRVVAGHDRVFAANPLWLAIPYIGDIDKLVSFNMARVDSGAIQPDARVVAIAVQQAVINARQHKVFHRIAGNCLGDQLTHNRTGYACIAIGKVKNIGLVTTWRFAFQFANAEMIGPGHPHAITL
jgi:hypothetical protein